jgi:hypothetical protein
MIAVLSAPLLAALLFASAASGADEKKPTRQQEAMWQRAMTTFSKYYRHKKPEEREKAAKAIADAICPGVHVKAARYLVTVIKEELKRGKDAEEQIHYRVIEASVFGLGKITEEKAVKWLLDMVKKGSESWRLRYHVIDGLGAKDNPMVVEALCAGAKDADPKIQLASIDTLGRMGLAAGLDTLFEALKSPLWQVQIAAIHAIGKIPLPDKEQQLKVADVLVEAMQKVNETGGRVKWELVQVLEKLAGKKMGYDVMAWQGWLARQRQGKTAEGRMATMPIIPTYHGVKIWSNRVVFVIDITGRGTEETQGGERQTPGPVQDGRGEARAHQRHPEPAGEDLLHRDLLFRGAHRLAGPARARHGRQQDRRGGGDREGGPLRRHRHLQGSHGRLRHPRTAEGGGRQGRPEGAEEEGAQAHGRLETRRATRETHSAGGRDLPAH